MCAGKGRGKWRGVVWSGVERRGVARCGQNESADVKNIRHYKGSFLCSTAEHIENATIHSNLTSNQSAFTYQNIQRTKYVQADVLDRRFDLIMVLDSETGQRVLIRAHMLFLCPRVAVKVSNTILLKFHTTIQVSIIDHG
jgi:hypothetical protein